MQAVDGRGVHAVRSAFPGHAARSSSDLLDLRHAAERGLRRGTAGEHRLGEEGAVLIQVGEVGAQLAGLVQARDRVVVPVKDAARGVALRAAGGADQGRGDGHGVVRRGVDRRHLRRITAELGIRARSAVGVPLVDGGLQDLRIAAQLLRQLLDGVGLDDPALFDLSQVIAGPHVALGRGRPAEPLGGDGARLAGLLVEDQVDRQRLLVRQIDVAAILHVLHMLAVIALRLVIEAGAVRADLDPGIARHGEVAHEGGLVLRHLDAQPEAAGLGLVLHVPDLRAGLHEHLDAVAGVARGAGGVDHVHAVEVALHGQVVLIAAAGEQGALAGLDSDLGAVRLTGDHTEDLLGKRVLNQGNGRGLIGDLDVAGLAGQIEAAPHAAVLEGGADLAQVRGAAVEGGAFEAVKLDDHGAPLELAAADVAGLIADARRHGLNPRQLIREALAQPGQVLVRNRVGQVAVVQVGLDGLHSALGRNEERLAGSDGVAASQAARHLLEHQDLSGRVDVMRLDRSRGAGQAVAHDQEIDLTVPRLDLLNRGHPVLLGEAARAQRQRQHQGQKQTESFLHLFSSFLLSRVFCHVPDDPSRFLSRFCRNFAAIHRRYGHYIPSSSLRGKRVCKKINERFVSQISHPLALPKAANPQDSARFRRARRFSALF